MKTENSKYLQSEAYYSDLYDRFTVDNCRLTENIHKKRWSSKKSNKMVKEKWHESVSKMALEFILLFETGERYLDKRKTIQEWMERDRVKDELLNSAQPPENIQCLTCKSVMNLISKDLHDWGSDKKDRVLFMYDCPNGCLPRRAFFDDGEEYRRKPHLCPECNNALDHTDKKLKNKIITNYICSHCGHKEKDELDLSPEKEKIDKNFAKDRERFCLIEEQGQRYLEQKMQFEQMKKFVDSWKEKEKNKDLYDKVKKIKKLTVAGLQKILGPVLEKEGYIKLDFSKPEMTRGVIVQFTAQDNKTGRGEYDSIHQLQKLLKSTLEKTNWRLMSEGIFYRLGILTGRLKGYELEEDLLKLIQKQFPTK